MDKELMDKFLNKFKYIEKINGFKDQLAEVVSSDPRKPWYTDPKISCQRLCGKWAQGSCHLGMEAGDLVLKISGYSGILSIGYEVFEYQSFFMENCVEFLRNPKKRGA